MDIEQINGGRQFWQEQYEQWQNGDLSKAAFCRQASLKVTTFYYWCRVLARAEMQSNPHDLPTAFVPLELTRESASAFSLNVADVTISCNHPISANQLRQWLMAIRSSL